MLAELTCAKMRKTSWKEDNAEKEDSFYQKHKFPKFHLTYSSWKYKLHKFYLSDIKNQGTYVTLRDL